jgi:RecA-family ATPase
MIAGAPGGGKSAFALDMAIKMAYGEYNESPVPCMYFSADTDKGTLGTRAAAGIAGFTVDEAEELIKTGNQGIWSMLDQATSHIWFHWNRAPDLDDVESEVIAYAHVMGEYPHLIVIDNLKNIYVEGNGESGDHIRYDRVLDSLHELAGITGACIIVLHHVAGWAENGDQPIPLAGILGKVTKPFGLILTLHKAWENMLGICVVKNRTGRGEANGSFIIHMPYDLERMRFNHISQKERMELETQHDWHSGNVRN